MTTMFFYPKKGSKCRICGESKTEHTHDSYKLNNPMSNSTQNDEIEVDGETYVKWDTQNDIPKWSKRLQEAYDKGYEKGLAYARREVIDRVESEGVVNRAWIKIDGNEFILVGKEFLATLREEES